MGKAGSHILKALMVFWAFLVIPDYFFNHAYYGNSLSNFAYFPHILFSIIGFGGFLFWRMEKNGNILKKFSISISGWQVYLGVMLSSLVLYMLFHNHAQIQGNAVMSGLNAIGMGTLYTLGFLWIILSSFCLGQWFMKRIREHYHLVSYQILSIALGMTGIGIIATLLGLFHFMNPYVLWAITLALIGIFHKEALDFLQSIFIRPVTYKALNIGKTAPLFILFIFLAAGFLSALKAFPIGFDGAGVYMNTPSLIVNYGGLPEGGQAFNWAIIMSLGELMFGQTAISIIISHFTIFLVLAVMYRLARLAMAPSRSWIPISIFYALPVIVFQCVREEKNDFGLLFIVLAAFLLLLEPRFTKKEVDAPISSNWVWGMAGWLLGFAFGIKVLAIYAIVAILALWAYRQWGKFGAFGMLSFSTALLFLSGLNDLAYMDLASQEVRMSAGMLGIVGIASLAYGWVSHEKIFPKAHFTKLLLFIGVLIIPMLPWGIKHISEHGGISSISQVLKGKSPTPGIDVSLKLYADETDLSPLQDKRNKVIQMDVDSLPTRNFQKGPVLKRQKNENLTSSEREEIKRYLGYEKGYTLYHTLAYDATMGNNIPNRPYIDISFLFLLILPFLLFRLDKKGIVPNAIYLTVFISSILGMGWITQYIPMGDYSKLQDALTVNMSNWIEHGFTGFSNTWSSSLEGIMNIAKPIDLPLFNLMSSFGFCAMLVTIILFTLGAWWMMKDKFHSMEPAMQELAVLFYATFFLWFISGNNIPWYGFPSLSLACIFIGYLFQKPDWVAGKDNATFMNYFLGISLGIFFLFSTILRLSNPEIKGENSKLFIDHTFIQQASMNKSKSEVLDLLTPSYNIALSNLNHDLDSKIYRIGTHLNYHIQENDRRVYEDNQLKLFGFHYKRLPDSQRFIQLLKNNGFKHIVYDFNTPLLDKTPEKSLQKKSDAFVGTLLNSTALKLVATDRVIQSSNANDFVVEGGVRRNGLTYGLGTGLDPKFVKKNGTFMVYEIL